MPNNNQFGVIGAPPSVQGGNVGYPTTQMQAYQYPDGRIVYQPVQQPPTQSVQFPPSNAGNQTNQQSNMLPVQGRFVESENDITPKEVSMDGQISLFPTWDCSCIYAKAWTSNGTIQTVKYVPMVESQDDANSQAPQNDISNEILSRLDAIEKKLDKKPYYNGKKNYSKTRETKKDGDVNA